MSKFFSSSLLLHWSPAGNPLHFKSSIARAHTGACLPPIVAPAVLTLDCEARVRELTYVVDVRTPYPPQFAVGRSRLSLSLPIQLVGIVVNHSLIEPCTFYNYDYTYDRVHYPMNECVRIAYSPSGSSSGSLTEYLRIHWFFQVTVRDEQTNDGASHRFCIWFSCIWFSCFLFT